ncbi:hypothetical protein MD484_g4829, partial [Candolleomyces efflorescens]
MSAPSEKQNGKRARRDITEQTSSAEVNPAAIWKASKKPRIISKVHTTLQGISDPASKASRRNQASREEKAVMDDIASTQSPRPKQYPKIGKGMPTSEPRAATPEGKRIPSMNDMIKAIERDIRSVEIESREGEDVGEGPSTTEPALKSTRKIERVIVIEDSESEDEGSCGIENDEEGSVVVIKDTDDEEETNGSETESDKTDRDWTPEEETDTGSSDKYSVEEESLGYITSEDGSVVGGVVQQAILEASLEDLKIMDVDELKSMDRAKKRILLRHSELSTLRHFQLKGLVDEVDVGTVLLDRLDQELRRMGLNALSVLRMLELTEALITGSYTLPVLGFAHIIPNDLDIVTDQFSYKMVLSYLKKKGFTSLKQVYPQGGPGEEYARNLKEINLIFEVGNKRAHKINVIVSNGRAILPILQFHSTPVMNYIAHHGVVCLYDITLFQLGIVNYANRSARVERCIKKYQDRGFEMWDHFEEGHTCKIDGSCPQTIRSLFDRDVIHIRFPDYLDAAPEDLRKGEAELAVWRLANGEACNGETNEEVGFVLCDINVFMLRR